MLYSRNLLLIQSIYNSLQLILVLDANGNRVEGKFDHIYTDEELYKTFNLPQKYIDIIETVVKEREAIK